MNSLLIDNAFPSFDVALKNELASRGVLRLYKKGEIFVQTGKTIHQAYIILDGCVKVYREHESGGQFLLAFFTASKGFAVSLCDDSPAEFKQSKVTLSAIENTHVLCLSFASKDLLVKKYDQWYKYVLNTSVTYYEFFIKLVDNIAFKKLDFRIDFFLQGFSVIANSKILNVSHQQIATELNCSREAVTRALKVMSDAGKIVLKHNEIEIVQL
jgi:CRP/FNR family transcriptional regulator, anaerobic regulatory protein